MSYTRSAIVTGGTMNLGYHAAMTIARQHPDWLVVVCSRSDREHAAESINEALKQSNTVFMPLDLSSSKSVRDFARNWSAKNHPPVQALCLNAALQFPGKIVYTPEGLEATFAITHVGHALLFHLICSHLAQNARIVITSSGTHDPAINSGLPVAIYTTGEELAHPPPAIAEGPGRRHYANAKLANILWTYALHKRLSEKVPDRSITVNAFDPGLMPGTGLAREASPLMRWAWDKVMPKITPVLRVTFTDNIHRPEESGASLARLAISPGTEGISGKYFEGTKEICSSKDSYDEKKIEDLWQWTVKYCAQDEAEAAHFEQLR
ncbi:dehydrogenase/reductase [Xylaria bambusicola]|uniref:dehydrogenase/reductase n=1 Tax=Xylaria bambusicola TaxID=326684 RepID=UPI0020088DE4|nr:dehydrogenase/reductase [Xylaria bambusicola]KAI0509151.1 dehydrogenase/reductase [Xylaria bambusicola]